MTAGPHFAIAALQLELGRVDNLDQIEREISLAKRAMPWVQMVLLGELATFGATRTKIQPLPGPAEDRYREIAQRHGLWLVPGSLYERLDDRIYNTMPVINPAGEVVARYRKQFPFLPYEQGVSAGHEPVVFDVPGVGRFGLSICYDAHFPETSRSLCWLGAEVILHPTMTWTIDRDLELAIARATAATNQCYFVDVNVAGEIGNGRSIICGPGGEVIHQAGSGREIMIFEVDFAHLRRVRERGWNGLGQHLKSFRDGQMVFPAYGAGVARSEYLASLGKLEVPGSRGPDGSN